MNSGAEPQDRQRKKLAEPAERPIEVRDDKTR
jgi:hypothetical protein